VSGIHIVERISTRPGAARAMAEAIRRDYLPLAGERGMTLDRILVSPPIFDPELSNEVTVLWTVPDAKAWWLMAKSGRADTRAADFWRSHADLIVERHRSMATGDEQVEEVCNV